MSELIIEELDACEVVKNITHQCVVESGMFPPFHVQFVYVDDEDANWKAYVEDSEGKGRECYLPEGEDRSAALPRLVLWTLEDESGAFVMPEMDDE